MPKMDQYLPSGYRWAEDHEHKKNDLPVGAINIPVERVNSTYGHAELLKRLAVPK